MKPENFPEYDPAPAPLPVDLSGREMVAALNDLRAQMHASRQSRHSHQSQVAGVVNQMQLDLIDVQRSYASDLRHIASQLEALSTALTGGSLGAHGLVKQVQNLAADIAEVMVEQSVHRQELDALRHLRVKADRGSSPWWKHPVFLSVAAALAISALAKSGPWIGAVFTGIK